MSNFNRESCRDFILGNWHVYPSINRIRQGERVVRIQHLSMQVLVYLAQRPRIVATYDELLDSLWPGRVTSEEAVHRRIADLRRHLEDDSRSPDYIETIPKRGYRLVSNIRPLTEPAMLRP